ncbi:LicD family protein [Nocardioides sp.]|uniref:class I SAM-dependent methyltransferase n=1 Tax=Nocardioides sp. TaxID=35761 RepID=UPI003511DE5B
MSATRISADDDRLVLPGDLEPETTYDVVLNDVHVWSLLPSRDTVERGQQRVARWPKALRRHLVGRADVLVRDHVSGAEVGRVDVVFGGDDSRRVEVVDKHGAALVLDKYGRLTRPLAAEDDGVLDDFLAQVAELLRVMREEVGVASFISYGTLLGAVRNGRLIGHDNDVDISYVSEHEHPVDVVRETFRVERALVAHGWVVRRGSGTRLNVRLPQPDGTLRYVDVFTAHWTEGVFYMPSDTGFEIPRESILPLGTVTLHGREMPAPADSELLLAHTYGPNWAVPDPSFKYETPRWLARRLTGWFGGLRVDRKIWDAFYGGHAREVPSGPSTFATWVAEHHDSDRPLIDLGSGTGRDAHWFARRGREVTAVDYALGVLKRSAARRKAPAIAREVVNLNDLRQVYSLAVRLNDAPTPPDLYGRFLLSSLDEHGRDLVLRLASMTLRRGGLLLLEFRTHKDQFRHHHFPRKYRRFVDPAEVVAEIERRGGWIIDRVEGTGLAPLEREDPHVCRIVAAWAPGAADA